MAPAPQQPQSIPRTQGPLAKVKPVSPVLLPCAMAEQMVHLAGTHQLYSVRRCQRTILQGKKLL